jgi:hypothetical protein
VLIGILLMPINSYWVVMMGVVRYSGHPTTTSLFFNVVFSVLVVSAINSVIHRFKPRWALERSEMIVIYTFLCITSALAGHDGIQMLAPAVVCPDWYATPENNWQELFLNQAPQHWGLHDPVALRGIFEGGTSLYTADHIAPLLWPIANWSAFVVLSLVVMVYMNVILRKQWTENERLSFPLVEVPLEITRPGTPIFRNRLLWIGLSIAAGIDILNGLHVLYPQVPELHVRIQDMSRHIKTMPWRGMGWTPISFYPFAVGLGYMMPQDQLFSCWAFFIWWKGLRVLSTALGMDVVRGSESVPPYLNEQSFGGYIGLFVFSMWAMRSHLATVWRAVLGQHVGDEREPARYRTAFWVIVIGLAALVWLLTAGGMSVAVAIGSLAIYFMLSVVITRIRAELGHPVHDLHFAGPDFIIPKLVGTRSLAVKDQVGLSYLFAFNRAHRNHPMPHQLEGIKMGRDHGVNDRAFVWVMTLAAFLGSLSAWWGWLHPAYALGFEAKWRSGRSFGTQAFRRLTGWLLNPSGPDVPAIAAIGVGLVVVLGLMNLRAAIPGWPLHPIGYAVSSSWSMHCLWVPLLLAWVLKGLILRYGRPQSYRRAMPFFIGLVLGEFIVGSIWTIIGITLGIRTYGFWV